VAIIWKLLPTKKFITFTTGNSGGDLKTTKKEKGGKN
jgi:hypothetical protein